MAQQNNNNDESLHKFLDGKSAHTLALFHHFVEQYKLLGDVSLSPAKTMIGVVSNNKRIAWITQLGKSFIHVVFPFEQPYNDNLCFQKIAQVPGDYLQFNHHFRMLYTEDVNDEVIYFMKLAMAQK